MQKENHKLNIGSIVKVHFDNEKISWESSINGSMELYIIELTRDHKGNPTYSLGAFNPDEIKIIMKLFGNKSEQDVEEEYRVKYANNKKLSSFFNFFIFENYLEEQFTVIKRK